MRLRGACATAGEAITASRTTSSRRFMTATPTSEGRRKYVASSPMASAASREFPNLTVLAHPLIQHKLTILRDKRTSTRDFKQLVNEIAMLMAYEVTKDLPLEPVEIETPLEKTMGSQVAGKKLTLVPILRAGLGMVEGISQLIPSARVGHIGLFAFTYIVLHVMAYVGVDQFF